MVAFHHCATWFALANSILVQQEAIAKDWIDAYHKYYESH
jgi:hypothetical protein